jgi:hypothetical protein
MQKIPQLMLHPKRGTLAAALALALTIAASSTPAAVFPGSVPEKQLENVTQIGVVSALGNTFNNISIGTTVFGNKISTATVPDWKIDEFATQRIVTTLLARGRLAPAAPSADAAQIEALYREGKPEEIEPARVLEFAKAQGWPLVLVVHRVHYENTPFHVGGYGVFSRKTFGLEQKCAYSLFMVTVWNVVTRKDIAFRWGEPCLGGDKDLIVRPTFADYSAEEQSAIRDNIQRRLGIELDAILGRLKLLREAGNGAAPPATP